jgi:hypothetical protein
LKKTGKLDFDFLTDRLCVCQLLIADAASEPEASEPEASEQVSSSNSYWDLKIRFYFRFSDQNALLLTDQNASLLTDQNALHARCYINALVLVYFVFIVWSVDFWLVFTLYILNLLIANNL